MNEKFHVRLEENSFAAEVTAAKKGIIVVWAR